MVASRGRCASVALLREVFLFNSILQHLFSRFAFEVALMLFTYDTPMHHLLTLTLTLYIYCYQLRHSKCFIPLQFLNKL